MPLKPKPKAGNGLTKISGFSLIVKIDPAIENPVLLWSNGLGDHPIYELFRLINTSVSEIK